MSAATQAALDTLGDLTKVSIAAIEAESSHALRTLALLVRDSYRTATHFVLDDSDQGDWMVLQAVRVDGEDLDPTEDDFDDECVPSHLYHPACDWQRFCRDGVVEIDAVLGGEVSS